MREDYNYLSDPTKDTLSSNVKAMAAGWGKSEQYIYQILSGEKADFFPAFLSMYLGALKGGVSTCHWDNELEFARFRHQKPKNIKDASVCFIEKSNGHNSTLGVFIEALADGELDAAEIKKLEACLEKERQNIELIETMLRFKKDLLEK